MSLQSDSSPAGNIWSAITQRAISAGLDPQKFGDTHHQVVDHILDFLQSPATSHQPPVTSHQSSVFSFQSLFRRRAEKAIVQPVAPLIIYGKPGTGKTTFLYVVDSAIREQFRLPDNITPIMNKVGGYQHTVHKRTFCNFSTSLLSVRKWSELLHFYEWDINKHGFVEEDLDRFIRDVLQPMRVLFADEVEMTGYSPTIPDLAKQGILVVGTSNQTQFAQLEEAQVPPVLVEFSGADMRAGDPTDAIVREGDSGWDLFDRVASRPGSHHQSLPYQTQHQTTYLNFPNAMQAPFLETEWVNFIQATGTNLLLLDNFSLASLRTDYNTIIRFVTLLDAIEQIGLGVLVRHPTKTPQLAREAFEHMKVTIYSARGVPDEIKRKTVVGIDRSVSRLGQAGHRAQALLEI